MKEDMQKKMQNLLHPLGGGGGGGPQIESARKKKGCRRGKEGTGDLLYS